jgi:hypothetical protein
MVNARFVDLKGMELFSLSKTAVNVGPSVVVTWVSHELSGPPPFSRS